MITCQYLRTVAHVTRFDTGNPKQCVCYIERGIGYDAFNFPHNVVTDDFGNIVFVAHRHERITH